MCHLIRTDEAQKNRDHPSQESLRYDMRFLDESALQAVSNLQGLIARSLPSLEIFRLHEENYFKSLLKLDRFVIGIIIDDGLIAYSLISVPGKAEENLGRDIGLPEEELGSVAHLQAVAVHPAYRGNGLQKMMGAAHLKVIEEMGFEHVLCTVSPKNPVSLRNILSNGFVIRGLKPKFGGVWRYIMHRNLLHPISLRSCPVIINGLNVEGQLDLLDRGYLGFDILDFDSKTLSADFEVCYGTAR
jgi:ribosomal protein S18 acetylase RimI-like enzyme